MSARNQTIELVKQYYAFLHAGDVPAMLSWVSDALVPDMSQERGIRQVKEIQ